MKFVANTVSKPVVGKEAKALTKALDAGRFLATDEALATVNRIAARRLKKAARTNGAN